MFALAGRLRISNLKHNMCCDEQIVTHDGKQWLVRDGKLVPFREVFIDVPRTEPEYSRWMADRAAALNAEMVDYISKHDPYADLVYKTQK